MKKSSSATLWLFLFTVLLNLAFSSGTARAQTFPQDLDKAWALYSGGKYSEAADAFQNFFQKYVADPSFPEVSKRMHYLLALALVKAKRWGEVEGAIDLYQEAPGNESSGWAEELAFWKGVAALKTNEPDNAAKFFGEFLKKFPDSSRKGSIELMMALSGIQAKKWSESANLLENMRKNASAVDWGRYLLLETTSRIEAGENEKALVLVDLGHQHWDRLAQVAAFESLSVLLAEKLLEQPDKSEAIRSLIRIKPQAEVLAFQDQQLAALEKYAENVRKNDPSSVDAMLTDGLVAQVKTERQKFAEQKNFDSGVRFRIAQAFLEEGRYREAAFVLDTMLNSLPPDKLVEQGTETLAECYTQIGRWDKVIEVADTFAQKFPDSPSRPRLLIQKGLALQETDKRDEAEKIFKEFLEKYPDDPLAGDAAYLLAFNDILAEKFDSAAAQFAEIAEKYPDPVSERARYWEAQAYSMAGINDKAAEKYAAYLEKYPDATFSDDARYRHAFSIHAMGDFEKSVPELEEYVKANPDNPNAAEGRLLLGDAYFVRDDYPKAIETVMSIPKGIGGYREEAYFKVAKFYQLADEPEKLQELMQEFQREYPESPRLAESVNVIGQTYSGDPAKQREVFWSAIDRYGDQPAQWGVTQIIRSLIGMSQSPEDFDQLLSRLKSLAEKGRSEKKRALEMNARWGLAAAQAKSDPKAADAALVSIQPLLKPDVDNPQVMLEVAQALQRAGRYDDAIATYREIRRWNPTTPLNQAVFANLGLIAVEQNKPDEARDWFRRYFEETSASMMRGKILVASANLEKNAGNTDRALELYEEALKDKSVSGEQKAQSLLAIGDIQLSRGDPKIAIPYFQRIYVLYGAFPQIVAEAYLRSGKAFTELKDPLSAARTYQEMLNNPDLKDARFASQIGEARKRLEAIPADVRTKAQESKTTPPPAAATSASDTAKKEGE